MKRMNDEEYLTVMADLKFISAVGEGQFLNNASGTIENKNWYTCMVRSLYDMYSGQKTESGQSSAAYCRKVIVKALLLLQKYQADAELQEYAKTIEAYINDASNGIRHLKKTHEHNYRAYATFDTILVSIGHPLVEP